MPFGAAGTEHPYGGFWMVYCTRERPNLYFCAYSSKQCILSATLHNELSVEAADEHRRFCLFIDASSTSSAVLVTASQCDQD